MKLTARPVLMIAVAGLLAGFGVSAHAAPAPCNLVEDRRGDARGNPPGNYSAADIISADVASDSSRITAVIRLDDARSAITDTVLAPRWTLSFEVQGVRYFMRAMPFRGKIASKSGYIDRDTGQERELQTVAAVVDTNSNEVRITAPVRDFALMTTLRAGTVLRALQVQTHRVYDYGEGRSTISSDEASGGNYTAGTRSCVRVG